MTDLNKILYALSYAKAILQPMSDRAKGIDYSDATNIVRVLDEALACEIWKNIEEKK